MSWRQRVNALERVIYAIARWGPSVRAIDPNWVLEFKGSVQREENR